MMNFPARTAIFDMDGTLLDTMAYWRLAYVEFLQKHNLPTPDSIRHESAEKLFVMQTIRAILAAYPDFPMDEQQMYDAFEQQVVRHYADEAVCKPGAREFLQALRAQGVRIGLATATREDMALVALKKTGLLELFDFTYYGGSHFARKSDPAYFEQILQEQACKAADTVMFEDALYAMKGAKAAGLRVYAIEERFSLPNREEIRQLADCYVRDFTELMNQEETNR